MEQVKIERLIEHLGPEVTEMFPGEIDSIFIDMQDNVYIQSITEDNMTYLNVYSWQKIQLINTSFVGKILLYNQL